jgi:hypothetical protein
MPLAGAILRVRSAATHIVTDCASAWVPNNAVPASNAGANFFMTDLLSIVMPPGRVVFTQGLRDRLVISLDDDAQPPSARYEATVSNLTISPPPVVKLNSSFSSEG